ncbi:P-II family nitrogen regulator [Anaeromassilibacillus senegalensis]|uniref:P-II family nitrogen regulator n=1 Tax=Anaeromassilibacillus senegalensis TaxID=1673717 RepID=UPI000681478B|nr:P-II family nitrogen regulator [Anaeromassilibacillus senegalensis]
MSNMYYLVTVAKREYGEAFQQFFYDNGIHTMTAVLCEGTAQQKTLDRLGIEKTEKVMLSSVVSGTLAAKMLRGLMRTMQIDVPGNGIAFTIPLRSAANAGSLQYLTHGQNTEQDEVTEMEETRFSLVVVIVQKGHTEEVMDAARSANAGGGTIVHAKGVGEKSATTFFGVSIASEQELIYIVAKQKDEKNIMRAIMEQTGSKKERVAAAFSLPVNHVVGLRSLTDE